MKLEDMDIEQLRVLAMRLEEALVESNARVMEQTEITQAANRQAEEARTRVDNAEGMAECMQMFRADMIRMGVITEKVPPMFMTEAICNAMGERLAAQKAALSAPQQHAQAAQGWGYAMVHKTGEDRGFSWKADDPLFSADWQRVALAPALVNAQAVLSDEQIEGICRFDGITMHVPFSRLLKPIRAILATRQPAPEVMRKCSRFGHSCNCTTDCPSTGVVGQPDTAPVGAPAISHYEVTPRALLDFGDSIGVFMSEPDALRIIAWVLQLSASAAPVAAAVPLRRFNWTQQGMEQAADGAYCYAGEGKPDSERDAALEEAAKIAESVGRPVGAGDGGTYVPGTSADAARAIRAAMTTKQGDKP